MQEFQESVRRVVQLTFGLNVGRIGTRFLGSLLAVNVCHAYKSVLITIKKFYRFPERHAYTFAVADKALCSF